MPKSQAPPPCNQLYWVGRLYSSNGLRIAMRVTQAGQLPFPFCAPTAGSHISRIHLFCLRISGFLSIAVKRLNICITLMSLQNDGQIIRHAMRPPIAV
jgi:hypothetical protein